MDDIYRKYFQKSRSFLYPALGIKRTSFYNPSGTFISVEGLIKPEEYKLVCTFKEDTTEGFTQFQNNMLLGNPLFHDVIKIRDYSLYVFDFKYFTDDWSNFLQGKYSKLTKVLKKAIKGYYGESSSEYEYIESYLYPEKYFDMYAKFLDVSAKVIKETGELCDPPDLEKENLKIPVEDLEMLKKTV